MGARNGAISLQGNEQDPAGDRPRRYSVTTAGAQFLIVSVIVTARLLAPLSASLRRLAVEAILTEYRDPQSGAGGGHGALPNAPRLKSRFGHVGCDRVCRRAEGA